MTVTRGRRSPGRSGSGSSARGFKGSPRRRGLVAGERLARAEELARPPEARAVGDDRAGADLGEAQARRGPACPSFSTRTTLRNCRSRLPAAGTRTDAVGDVHDRRVEGAAHARPTRCGRTSPPARRPALDGRRGRRSRPRPCRRCRRASPGGSARPSRSASPAASTRPAAAPGRGSSGAVRPKSWSAAKLLQALEVGHVSSPGDAAHAVGRRGQELDDRREGRAVLVAPGSQRPRGIPRARSRSRRPRPASAANACGRASRRMRRKPPNGSRKRSGAAKSPVRSMRTSSATAAVASACASTASGRNGPEAGPVCGGPGLRQRLVRLGHERAQPVDDR